MGNFIAIPTTAKEVRLKDGSWESIPEGITEVDESQLWEEPIEKEPSLLDKVKDFVTPDKKSESVAAVNTNETSTLDLPTEAPNRLDYVEPVKAEQKQSTPAFQIEGEFPSLKEKPNNYSQSEDQTTTRPFEDGLSPVEQDEKVSTEARELFFGGKNADKYENPSQEGDFGYIADARDKIVGGAVKGFNRILGMEANALIGGFNEEAGNNVEEWFKKLGERNSKEILAALSPTEKNPDKRKKNVHTPTSVKQAIKEAGLFDLDTIQELGNFVLSTGGESAGDMAAMSNPISLPLYMVSRIENAAEDRAKNNGNKEATDREFFEVMPTEVTSVLMDVMGLKFITKGAKEKAVEAVRIGGLSEGLHEIKRQTLKGGFVEGTTESIQSPLEKFGKEYGTEKGLDTADAYLEESLWGKVAGTGMGAGLGGVSATVGTIQNYNETKRLEEEEDARVAEAGRQYGLGAMENAYNHNNKPTQSDISRTVVHPEIKAKVKNLLPSIATEEEVQDMAVRVQEQLADTQKPSSVVGQITEGKEEDTQLVDTNDVSTTQDSDTSPAAKVDNVLNASDQTRIKELQEKSEDELTQDDKWELEDLEKLQEEKNELAELESIKEPTEEDIFNKKYLEQSILEGENKDLEEGEEVPNEALQEQGLTQSDKKGVPQNNANTMNALNDGFEYSVKQFNEVGDNVGYPVIIRKKKENTQSVDTNDVSNTQDGTIRPSIEESKATKEKKKQAPQHIRDELALNEALHSSSEDALSEANKNIFKAKPDSEYKNLNKEQLNDINSNDFFSSVSKHEINNVYDFLSMDTKTIEGTQSSLTGLEPEGQNALFDTGEQTNLVTPVWAKDLVSDTTPYSDIVKAVAEAKQGNYSDLTPRIFNSLAKAGYPHLKKEIAKFDELSTRMWDTENELTELEEQELDALVTVLESYLDERLNDGHKVTEEAPKASTNDEAVQDTVKTRTVESGSESDSQKATGVEDGQDSSTKDANRKDGISRETNDTSGTETNGENNQPRVSIREQSPPEQEADSGSDRGIRDSNSRPDNSNNDGVQTDELSDGNESMGGHGANEENKLNEQQPTNADAILSKLDGKSVFDLNSKEPIRLTKGQRKKFNAEALEILKKPIEDITEADREILRHYTGEGGLDEVSEGSVNQHYTGYETVKGIYKTLKNAKVPMKKVLEPAVGSGNFVGMNPTANWSVVDIDTTNIEVTKRLYPHIEEFHAESYETFKGKNFDLIISNVPFASEKALLREHSITVLPAFKAIHNFYFAHSIDKLKDNGVMSFMTSTGTMDGTTKAKQLRKYLMSKGDILGAYRLPEKSQAKNTHTDTMIDIIMIQKRPSGVESRQKDLNAQFINIGSKDGFAMNEYFIANPEHLLGTPVIGKDKTKMGKEGWIVQGEADYSKMQINYEPYKKLKKEAAQTDFRDLDEARIHAKNNQLVLKTVNEAKRHLDIKTDEVLMFDTELSFSETDQTAMFGEVVKNLNANKIIDLNRIMSLTEDGVKNQDKALLNTALKEIENYQELYKKSPHQDTSLKKMMKENNAGLKLKEYMSYFDTNFNPAPVYSEKTRFSDSGKLEVTEKSHLEDRALFYSTGDSVIDTTKSYPLLSVKDIDSLLKKKTFVKSGENQIQLDFMYYGGNIYKKLDTLQTMNTNNQISKEEFLSQGAKLKALIPKKIPFSSIKIRGTESWLPSDVKNALVTEVGGGEVVVKAAVLDSASKSEIYNSYLNNKSLAPKGKDEPEQEHNERALEYEKILQEEILPAIKTYIESKGLTDKLVSEYNRNSNFYSRPKMEGKLLRDLPKSFRGKPFKMQQHQKEGAEQLVYNKKGVLAFQAGGGKTITAVVAIKQLLTQGVLKKPLFVVPVNTIAQWEETVKELYPESKVFEFPKLKTGANKGQAKEWSQLTKDDKEQMAFDLANNRYDFTIIGDTMFQKIGLSDEVLDEYVEQLVDEMTSQEAAENGEEQTKKEKKGAVSAAAKKKALKTGLKLAYKDSSEFDFSKLGFDAIIADEVQYYKNIGMQGKDTQGGLGTTISISYKDRSGKALTSKDIAEGANPHSATLGSFRSYDFRFKTRYVSEMNNGNNVFLLTGTPTPNKPLELMTLLQHLDPNILKEYGMKSSSDFVNTFYDLEKYETTDSTGAIVTREGLASMKNLSWLRNILDRFVDYRTFAEMTELPRPKQIDVEHYLELGSAGEKIFQDVQQRLIKALEDSKLVRTGELSSEEVENHLTVSGTGRSASIDLRLYDVGKKEKSDYAQSDIFEMIEQEEADHTNNKIIKTIDLVTAQSKKNSNSGQIIFLDRLTIKNPDGTKSSTHEELRQKLLDTGLYDPSQVVVVNGQAYTNPKTGKMVKGSIKPSKLQEIINLYNQGKIKVMVGNTKKMGVGVDLNRKTTDIYQIDIPYRPDEIEQRNNRGVRQGNENKEVRTHQFFQLGTLDKRSYEIVKNKRGFNDMYGFSENDISIEDGTSKIDNSEQVDPYQAIIDLEPDVFKKERLSKQRLVDNSIVDAAGHKKAAASLESTIAIKTSSIGNYESQLKGIDAALKPVNFPKYENIKDKEEKSKKILEYGNTLKSRKEKYLENIVEVKAEIKALESKLEERKLRQAKHTADTSFIKEEFTNDGKNVDLEKIRSLHTENELNEKYEVNAHKVDTKSTPSTQHYKKPSAKTAKKSKNKSVGNKLKKSSATNTKETQFVSTDIEETMPNNPPLFMEQTSLDSSTLLDGYEINRDTETFLLDGKRVKYPKEKAPVGVDLIRTKISRIIGFTPARGRIKGKDIQGLYRDATGELRTRNYSDLEFMAHELGHDIYLRADMKSLVNEFAAELSDFSYTLEPDLLKTEGYAEFMRAYFTNNSWAKENAPKFHEAFEVQLKGNKDLNKKIKEVQKYMHFYYAQGYRARSNSQLAAYPYLESTKERVINAIEMLGENTQIGFDKFQLEIFDRTHGFYVAENMLNGDKGLNINDISPTSLLRTALGGATSTYEQVVVNGVPEKSGDGFIFKEGTRGLRSIFDPILNDNEKMKEWTKYALLVNAQQLEKEGKNHGFKDSDNIGDMIQELENKESSYQKIFEDYQSFNNDMLDFYVQMSYVTKKTAKSFREKNPIYLPTHRVLENAQQSAQGNSATGFRSKSKTGSDLLYNDIIDNITAQLHTHIQAAMLANAQSELFSSIATNKDGGKIAHKISKDVYLNRIGADEQAKNILDYLEDNEMTLDIIYKEETEADESTDATTDEEIEEAAQFDVEIVPLSEANEDITREEKLLGVSAAFKENPDLLTYFTYGNPPKKIADSRVIKVIINDKEEYFEFSNSSEYANLVATTLDSLGSFQVHGVVGKAYKLGVQFKDLKTKIITTAPQFKAGNIKRDYAETLMWRDARKGANTLLPHNPLLGAKSFAAQDDFYKLYMLNGGGYGSFVEANTEHNYKDILLDSFGEKFFRAYSIDEYANRLTVAIEAKKAGLSWQQTVAYGRAISLDFSMRGSNQVVQVMTNLSPFLRASMNGSYKIVQEFRREGRSGKAIRAATFKLLTGGAKYLLGLSAIAFFMGKDDDRYKKLTADEKARFLWFFYSDTKKPIMIEIPHAVGFVTQKLPEYLADSLWGVDIPKGTHREAVLFAFNNQIFPHPDAGVFTEMYELGLTNKNFKGDEIVPHYMQKREAPEQYSAYTRELYRDIGEATNLSPVQIQHLISSLVTYPERTLGDLADIIMWDREKHGEPLKTVGQIALEVVDKNINRGGYATGRNAYKEGYNKIVGDVEKTLGSFNFLKKQLAAGEADRFKDFMEHKSIAFNRSISKIKKGVDKRLKAQRQKQFYIKKSKDTTENKQKKLENINKKIVDIYKNAYSQILPIEDKIEQFKLKNKD